MKWSMVVVLIIVMTACSRSVEVGTRISEVSATTAIVAIDQSTSILTPVMISETVNVRTSETQIKATKAAAILTATLEALTPDPSPTPRPTRTPLLSPTPSNTPLVSQSQLDGIFKIYPLAVDDERIYEVSIRYAMGFDDNDNFIYEEWNGLVHETVIEQRSTEYDVEFDLYYPDYPSVSSFIGVETGERTRTLKYREDGVYEYGYPLLLFPLEEGQEWLAFGPDFPEYRWVVGERENVTTPAGSFTDCYQISLWTRPDHMIIWFCNGIGVVREFAAHHPPDWIREWQLYQLP